MVVSVASISRTISDSHDNVYTLVRNTNGNIWDCTGPNIQAAINDVANTGGGTVWVGSDVVLSTPLIPKNDVRIDFQNNKVTFSSDCSFINLTGDGSTGLRRSIIENAYVIPYAGTTKGIIHVYIPDDVSSNNYKWTVRHNLIRNINIVGGSTARNFIGIHFEIDGASSILDNRFENIFTDWAGTGIKLECNAEGWANGNIFDNIYVNYYKTFIDFDLNVAQSGGNGFNYNEFRGCRCQTVDSDTYSYHSEYGVKDIVGYGNVFRDCLVWDWYLVDNQHAGTGIYEWKITSSAHDTNIDAMSITAAYYLDQGIGTHTEVLGDDFP